MAGFVTTFKEAYNQTMELRDRRVDGWFLMDSPWPTAIICMAYVYLVKYIGPRFMKDREPFELRRILLIYNITMVLFSFYLFAELGLVGWLRDYSLMCQPVDYSNSPIALRGFQVWGREYSLRCQPVDYSNSPKALKMARACYWYYISKFVELSDTLFFVLRKKFIQISTLHVIHHGVMPMSVWFGVRFTPGGHSTFFGLLNTFVHIFMYTYYTLAAMGPKYQKYLWWKRYMTALQMIQFILVMIHSFQLLFIDCNYPRAFVWWIGGHAVMFLFLFADFYKSTYSRKTAAIAAAKLKAEALKNGVSNGIHKMASSISQPLTNGSTLETKNGHTKYE